jgi:hypothetical protein
MKKISLFLSILVLSACTLRAEITPEGNTLPDAITGTPYLSEIHITGGAVYSLDANGKERFVGDISPADLGLSLKYCNDSPAHNCVQVEGIPVRAGEVKIRVSGGLFGTNVASGSGFSKTYTLTIKDPVAVSLTK